MTPDPQTDPRRRTATRNVRDCRRRWLARLPLLPLLPLLLLVCVWPPASATVSADEWLAPTVKEVFSDSREWFVRITPGSSRGDLVGFAGSPKGPYARAEFYRRGADRHYRLVAEPTLLNPVAPVDFVVTNRGYLMTFDNWHNLGYGTVVAGYGPDGRLLFAYELKDLFGTEEIAGFGHSTSSIQWRSGRVYVREDQRSVYVTIEDGTGTALIVEPDTGAWQHCAWREGQYRCRDRNAGRVWEPFREPFREP